MTVAIYIIIASLTSLVCMVITLRMDDFSETEDLAMGSFLSLCAGVIWSVVVICGGLYLAGRRINRLIEENKETK